VFALGIALNLLGMSSIPRGIVGFDSVARSLAKSQPTGNVLMCCWDDQELIFRFRQAVGNTDVQLIRGDRVLAVRLPEYAKQEAVALATQLDELLDVVRRGKARYMVTSGPPTTGHDRRFPEMLLAHESAIGNTDQFRLIGKWPVLRQFDYPGTVSETFVWQYLGELSPGPSELRVRIPTANIELGGLNATPSSASR
jgi:hypothetical protein